MNSLEKDYKAGILNDSEPPCLSLYEPTHRHYPENLQDAICFRNLVKELEEKLLKLYTKHESELLLAPFLALAEDRDFWNHNRDGLAILSTKSIFRVYQLQRPVAELVVVADRFHTRPLLRILQSADRYQVLSLTMQGIKFYEGNRDALDEIELTQGIPQASSETLGDEVDQTLTSYGAVGGVGGSHLPMHHGHGGKEPEVDGDAKRFFRAVDRAILEHYSRPSGLPLILATLPDHRHLFHQISHNPLLVKDGIDLNPEALSPEELRQQAWQVLEPHYLARLASLVEAFGTAQAQKLGEDELIQVAQAAVAGQVATLLIEANREMPGRIDPETGVILEMNVTQPEANDVIDDLGALVLKMGGQVIVIPKSQMPTGTGIAAIYRYGVIDGLDRP